MIDIKDKLAVAAVSAMLSGGLTMGLQAANTAGRLTTIEIAIQRVEKRLDGMIDNQHQVARAQQAQAQQP